MKMSPMRQNVPNSIENNKTHTLCVRLASIVNPEPATWPTQNLVHGMHDADFSLSGGCFPIF